MKKLLLIGLLFSIVSISATGHKELCSKFSKQIHSVVGVKSKGPRGEKGGLTDDQYNNCVKTGKVTVTLTK